MQTVPDNLQQLSSEPQLLLDRLSRQFVTTLFDMTAAAELIERGFARRSDGGLDITDAGLRHSQTS